MQEATALRAVAPLCMAGWLLFKAARDRRAITFDGALVLITGGSSGIGRALARLLTSRGADVIIVARGEAALRQVEAEINQRGWGGRCRAFRCDCADAAQVQALVEDVQKATAGAREGAPDVVINCAGAGRWLMLDELTPDELRTCFEAPVLAAANVCRAFVPLMRHKASASVVNVQSPGGFSSWGGCTAYISARWGLHGLTLALQVYTIWIHIYIHTHMYIYIDIHRYIYIVCRDIYIVCTLYVYIYA